MTDENIQRYISETSSDIGSMQLTDPRFFDVSYVPDEIFIRQDSKPIVEELILYGKNGAFEPVIVYGGAGYGKTVTVRKFSQAISEQYKIPLFYVSCLYAPTLYKIYASILGKGLRSGYGASELQNILAQRYPRCIIILDEIHHLRDNALLYFASRDEQFRPLIISMTQHLRWLETINDPGIRSSFRPREVLFKPYDAQEIYEILRQRAERGLSHFSEDSLRYLAAKTRADYQSDMRTALIALKKAGKTGKWATDDIEMFLKQADVEKWKEAVHRLTDRQLNVLRVVAEENRTNKAHQVFKDISKRYFFQLLEQLQTQDMIMLIPEKYHGGRTYQVEILIDPSLIAREIQARSTLDGY